MTNDVPWSLLAFWEDDGVTLGQRRTTLGQRDAIVFRCRHFLQPASLACQGVASISLITPEFAFLIAFRTATCTDRGADDCVLIGDMDAYWQARQTGQRSTDNNL